MKSFRINYIDGYDLKYKSFETNADSEEQALDNLWAAYPYGDFDHQIAEVIVLNKAVDQRMRIGTIDNSPFAITAQ